MSKKITKNFVAGAFSHKRHDPPLSAKETNNELDHAIDVMQSYYNLLEEISDRENNEEDIKDNLEYDLLNTSWVVEKAKSDNIYAQNIYAALCNNEFQKQDNWCILSDKKWSCSWRYAGGIASELCGQGDYLDFYCSGIKPSDSELLNSPQPDIIRSNVPEQIVTDEVRDDLLKLGWIVLKDDNSIDF